VSEIYRIYRVFDHFRRKDNSGKDSGGHQEFRRRGRNNPGDFLRYAFDEEEGVGLDHRCSAGINAVKVMTIHKAKGLGFPVVILLMYEGQPVALNTFLTKRSKEFIYSKLTRKSRRQTLSWREV
jgi:superfamily I DNA/RNA helicase